MRNIIKKIRLALLVGLIGLVVGIFAGISTGIVGLGDAKNGAIIFGPIGGIFGFLSVFAYEGWKK